MTPESGRGERRMDRPNRDFGPYRRYRSQRDDGRDRCLPREEQERMKRSRWLGAGLFGLAVGLAATALLGPLGAGVIRYRVSGLMLSQLKGVDLVSLTLIAPLCAVIGLLARRSH